MPVPALTDTDLLAAARRGELAAREQLVDRHIDTVRAVCRSRLASSHDVADAVQDTFVRALVNLDQVSDPDALGAWLRAIAVRVCADHGRQVSRTICLAEPVADEPCLEPVPLEAVVTAEERSGLVERLRGLAERDRRALWLRDALELPVADVAADLGLTEGSTRVLLTRARKRLRAAYQGVGGIAVGGWFRLRHRLAGVADKVPVDVPAALAAQLALVVAVSLTAPSGGGDHVSDPAPSVAATAPTPHGFASFRALAPGLDERAAAGGTGAAPAPSGPSAPASGGIVDVGEEPPAEPEAIEVSTSDEDGELVELLFFLGDTFGARDTDEDAEDEGETSEDGGGDEESPDEGDDEEGDRIELFPRRGGDRGAGLLAD